MGCEEFVTSDAPNAGGVVITRRIKIHIVEGLERTFATAALRRRGFKSILRDSWEFLDDTTLKLNLRRGVK